MKALQQSSQGLYQQSDSYCMHFSDDLIFWLSYQNDRQIIKLQDIYMYLLVFLTTLLDDPNLYMKVLPENLGHREETSAKIYHNDAMTLVMCATLVIEKKYNIIPNVRMNIYSREVVGQIHCRRSGQSSLTESRPGALKFLSSLCHLTCPVSPSPSYGT